MALSSRGGLQDIIMRRILSPVENRSQPSHVITIAGTNRDDRRAQNRPHRARPCSIRRLIFSPIAKDSTNLGFSGNFVRLPSTGMATLGETLERSPDQVRRLTRAIARARAFAKDNKAKILPTLKRALRIDDEDLLSKIYEQHKQVETADGRVDAQLDRRHHPRRPANRRNITKEIPANQVFDFSYLPAR